MFVHDLIKAPLRMKPSFLIVGTQKGGTSSLYDYLLQHPQVLPSATKEIHYFDTDYRKGWRWYRSHFPGWLSVRRNRLKRNCVTGEASPYYMFHPRAPERIADDLPQVKLIVMLRHPVDRAYSHYQMLVRLGKESLSFENAIELEPQRLQGEVDRLMSDPDYYSFEHQYRSYLTRGHYVDQVRQLRRLFPERQILVSCSEDFFRDPHREYNKVVDFLGLERQPLENPCVINQGQYADMSPATRARLLEYYAPFNLSLYSLLGRTFNWEK